MKVEIKDEGYNNEGQLIGPISVDSPMNTDWVNGHWGTLKNAIELAGSIENVEII